MKIKSDLRIRASKVYTLKKICWTIGRRLEKNYLFCEPCFLSLFRPQFVRYIQYIGNIRLIYRTNCALSRTKKHAQNKSDISDLYIGQIVP